VVGFKPPSLGPRAILDTVERIYMLSQQGIEPTFLGRSVYCLTSMTFVVPAWSLNRYGKYPPPHQERHTFIYTYVHIYLSSDRPQYKMTRRQRQPSHVPLVILTSLHTNLPVNTIHITVVTSNSDLTASEFTELTLTPSMVEITQSLELFLLLRTFLTEPDFSQHGTPWETYLATPSPNRLSSLLIT